MSKENNERQFNCNRNNPCGVCKCDYDYCHCDSGVGCPKYIEYDNRHRKIIYEGLWRFNTEILTDNFVSLLDKHLHGMEHIELAKMLSAYKKLRDMLKETLDVDY